MDDLRNRSLGELFADLSRDTAMLLRKEIELARLELGGIAGRLARRAIFLAIGIVLCVAGALSLMATATLAAMALGLSALAASAAVTGLVLAIGVLLVWRGLAAFQAETYMPTETIQTLKDAGQIFRTQVDDARAAAAPHAGGV
jgi:hypothetical protein